MADIGPDDDAVDHALDLFLYGLLANDSRYRRATARACDQYALETD